MRRTTYLPFALAIFTVVLISLPSSSRAVPDYSDLPPGPYCRTRYPAGRCCVGRRDECSAPILTTFCYCDDFCNRTRETGDCCPDYWSHCKGIEPPQEIRDCSYNDYNCNKCKCINGLLERGCETNKRCLIDNDLIGDINNKAPFLGWDAKNYSQFWGKTLAEGVQLRLGTLNPSKSVYKMNPVAKMYNPLTLPRAFDAREKWPGDISEIRDQGWCAASWAISTVDVASDRYFIMSKGAEQVKLSPQHLLSCNNRGQQGCKGGYLDRAWLFTRKFGLVDEDCYPWIGQDDKCRIRKKGNLQQAGCRAPMNPFRKEMYKVGPAYRLGNETDIMQEIMESGPVQATMRVYQDFFIYKSGIYRHSTIAERYPSGYHSVRIIGWGEDVSRNGGRVKYWLAANSWGYSWGENGLFRIVRGINECEIESFVLAAWAKTI
ncbi:tubulointerstitial nephritis antigen-like [Cephus cinctus]|uniref:Tubulointerstitial nephritis antigen-like n=1 Tax=Cephus cinctus TaxID=211228 RepID=A0AAJ7CDG3_CEPCN|nr:tubulointerstitial nephritis antigen-like [Cephus cinctus]